MIESVQPVEAARVVPQVLAEMAKSDALVPMIVGVCSVAVLPPVLETVMFCAAEV